MEQIDQTLAELAEILAVELAGWDERFYAGVDLDATMNELAQDTASRLDALDPALAELSHTFTYQSG